jgi:oligopeptide/dipeptide ABC transporter ATP-binding protein
MHMEANTTNDTLLSVRNLQVDFRSGKKSYVTAVSHVSFDLHAGEVLGIVGESGCGKSVTANSIMRLLPKETALIRDGEILFKGKDILKMNDAELRDLRGKHIGMIFQEPMSSLNPVYRIEHQMTEMLKAHRHLNHAEAHEECLKNLEAIGIPDPARVLQQYPHQLSGGMRQRIMIAMVLSVRPEIIIADEPTTALDVTIQGQILDLLIQLREKYGTAIIIITHDMGVVAEIADRVLIMYGGNVMETGSATQIFDDPTHPYTKGLLRSIPHLDRDEDVLYTIKGTVPALKDMPKGCHFCTRCELCQPDCLAAPPELRGTNGHLAACYHLEKLPE